MTHNAVSTLWPSSLPILVAHPNERHANRQLLCWSVMTDRESIVHLAQMKKKMSYIKAKGCCIWEC